ncbi:hypothetical protein Cyast_1316 [Cyanobacterium stanieri PCC 7202]|uniref:Uncharacterized protein n=1 Tax=Cyanobacterium stanieri (strain ATCC 29140 / PCC 7202) TaxID=292563 RepID=K9YK03_CYASC|nr:hypothetical protein Cyast_1316 [Cyanobacterium stanieri PCC 7202]
MIFFKPSEIVCLDNQNKSLYCEIIDVITQQNKCWVRPLMLVNFTEQNEYERAVNNIEDLRFTSDLLWSTQHFRPVFDTEYITFCCQLPEFEFDDKKILNAKKILRHFIQDLWLFNSK